VRQALMLEVEKANSALAYEELPLIAISTDVPVKLTCLGASCTVLLDEKDPAIAASITNEWGEKPVTFLIQPNPSVAGAPLTARRVSLTPDIEALVSPGQIAAVIVEELIAGAP
jgi:hypothetical protein